MDSNIFVGRQPVFNRKGNIFAYELLYRNSDENKFPDVAPEKATIELLINTFLQIGYDDVANRTKVFINFTETLLYDDILMQLDPRFVIIEVLEEVEVTNELIRHLKQIRERGFKIALDDFLIQRQTVLYDELYKIVHIIKVDFRHTSDADKAKIEALPQKYRHLSLLAEKIETKQEHEYALRRGYGLFQGYLFAKPEIIKGKSILSDRAMHLYLFKKLNEQEPDINEITNVIKRDVSLSYKVLRYINSFAFDMPTKISSIKQAIMLMGLKEARKWLQLLLFHDIGNGEFKGRERVLIERSINRAKACELLAQYKREPEVDKYFLLGMFSCLDVIMNENWKDILPKLSLTHELEAALTGEDTAMQNYLQLVKAVEEMNMGQMKYYAEQLEIPIEKMSEISLAAHRWLMKIEW